MQNIKNILVVMDRNNNDTRALERGLWLARSVNASVTVMTNVWDAYSAENTALDEDTRYQLQSGLKMQAQKWLQSFLEQGNASTVTIDVRWKKHLFEAVIDAAHQHQFDLVLKAPDRHSLMDRIFTPIDWNLLRHCPCPVMLVRTEGQWKNNRVLASIDATSQDEGHKLINDNILAFAENLADHLDTDLHLVNAYPLVNVAFAMVPEVTAPEDLHNYVQKQHEEACRQWARKYNINSDQIHVQEGAPEIVVPDLADEIAADLVVIGSIGRSGISGVLIGNTAELLLDKLPCDILVIKPTDGIDI